MNEEMKHFENLFGEKNIFLTSIHLFPFFFYVNFSLLSNGFIL